MRRAVDEAERAGDMRLLAMAWVALAEASIAAGDDAARGLLTSALTFYAEAGAGDGADHAAELLATLG
ncbi:MAG: hypothetical protein ABS81_13350 [Pseudonocardia sp. SCN 72-86]|nr:MAG: hypothetical protein ABS81_13350 [Pseudonocardia sp. SCN 72-86]